MTSPSGGNQYQQDVGAPGGPHGPKITSIFDFSAEALEALAFWLEQRGLHIPITQILGFSGFTVSPAATISNSDTTTSATLVALTHPGPVVSNLPAGKYVVAYGCDCSTSATTTNAAMAIVDSNSGLTIATGTLHQATTTSSVMKSTVVTFTAASTTLTAKYQSTDGVSTATFANRWLWALKYSNP